MSILVLVLLGAATGVTTVLFGFGGGFVTVPVVFWVDASAGPDALRVATATSMAVMVVNAGGATVAAHRSGIVRLRPILPLLGPLALGGALGAVAALLLAPGLVRVLFVAYLVIAIADLVLRPGFVRPAPRAAGAAARDAGRALGRRGPGGRRTTAGVGIGAIASLLGVGGSVMTVPILRRRGRTMDEAAALANPLSLAIAVPAFLVATLGAGGATSLAGTALSGRTVGLVDVVATLALLGGSLPTIALLRRVGVAIPDRIHARAYVALLIVVAAVMSAVPAP